MAAHSPRDTDNPSDDSHIFRRSVPKLPEPEEPIELLDFEEILDGDEDAIGGPTAANPNDSPSVIVRRGYSEGSSVNLGGRDDEGGSSIFAPGDSLQPSAPGSGWFDSIPPVVRTVPPVEDPSPAAADLHASEGVDDFFASLDGDSVAVPVTGWKDQQGTDSITESEVIRAFDNLSSRDVTARLANPDDGPDFDAVQPSGSNIFSHPDADDIDFGGSSLELDPSGVDLLNPENDDARNAGPKSSIFGAGSDHDMSHSDFDEIPLSLEQVPPGADAGSSIFDKKSPFGLPDDSADRASGTVDWEAKPVADEYQPSMRMPRDSDEDDSDPFAEKLTDFSAPAPRQRGPVGTAGAGAVVAPPKRREPVEDKDDEPIRAPKRAGKGPRDPEPKRGGGALIGWIGGGLFGMLVGAGAFAGLYFADVLPGKDSAKAATPIATPPTVKDNSAELAALTTKNDELQSELKTAQQQDQMTKKRMAAVRVELDSANAAKDAALAEATEGKATALKETTALKAEVKTALAAATKADDDAKKSALELKTAMADLDKATADAKVAVTEAEKAKADTKVALTDAEKAKAETKIYRALVDKTAGEAETAQKDALAKAKLAAEAQVKATDALKAQVAAESGFRAVVKSLKANELLEEKSSDAEALALIPDVLNRLTIRAAESDAKRAAKELAAMRKKIELFEGSVKGLEAAKTKADADAKRAKDDADALVSTAEKKAAADIAAAKKDADAAKKLADAEAKKKVDAAEADLASSMMKHTEELKRLQESFAGRLAEARKGGVLQITPAEVLTQDRAARDYNAGVRAYRAENFPKALASLESAVKLDPVDARYWYYLGLAQFELGKKADAEASFKKGSDLEIRSQPSSKLVGEALERVQGAARKELGEFR